MKLRQQRLRCGALAGLAAACFGLAAHPALAAPSAEVLFNTALCQPAYTMDGAMALYKEMEKVAKADTSRMGLSSFRLSAPVSRDGFTSSEVFFANDTMGLLIDGLKADQLAERYKLSVDNTNLLGTASKAYVRELPANQQPPEGLAGPGKTSIVARESKALPGKTILACEFVSDANRRALELMRKPAGR